MDDLFKSFDAYYRSESFGETQVEPVRDFLVLDTTSAMEYIKRQIEKLKKAPVDSKLV
jgi:hypothetical protein